MSTVHPDAGAGLPIQSRVYSPGRAMPRRREVGGGMARSAEEREIGAECDAPTLKKRPRKARVAGERRGGCTRGGHMRAAVGKGNVAVFF